MSFHDTQLNLGKLGQTIDGLYAKDNPFAHLHDSDFLRLEPDFVPEGRRQAGQYEDNETRWLASTQKAIEKGIIDKDTLVVSVTGHSLPMAEVITNRFASDVITILPAGMRIVEEDVIGAEAYDIRKKGIYDQAQSFVHTIARNHDHAKRDGASTVVMMDVHGTALPEEMMQKFPSAQELQSFGFKNILVVTEDEPFEQPLSLATYKSKDIKVTSPQVEQVLHWLEGIQSQQGEGGSLKIAIHGLDTDRGKRTVNALNREGVGKAFGELIKNTKASAVTGIFKK